MLPIVSSGNLLNYQTVDWSIQHYDSSMSTPERGIGFRLFNPSTSFTTAGMQAASDPTTYVGSNGTPVLTNSGTWGLNPMIMDYWGGGAPAGVTRAGYTVLHWRGYFGQDFNWAHPRCSNQLYWSEDLTNAKWTPQNTTVTSNATTAPNGTSTADKLVETTANSSHGIYQAISGLTTKSVLVGSQFFKAAERTTVRLNVADSFTLHGAYVVANLSTGTIVTTGTIGSGTLNAANIHPVGNGWYWVWCSAYAGATTTGIVNSQIVSGTSVYTYTGDAAKGLYMWGGNLEVGSSDYPTVPSSYTFTSGTLPTTSSNKAWLAFLGRGFIRVQLNGSNVLSTRLNNVVPTYSTQITPQPNDRLDVYYWQLGEDWGGVVGKYVATATDQTTTLNITPSQYREAPPISAALVPYSVATAYTLQQVSQARVESTGNLNTAVLSFQLPISNTTDVSGWRLVSGPRRAQFTDPVTKVVTTLKRGQLIKFYAGTQGELYPRFVGHITNIDEQGGAIAVECQDLSERMSKINVENYPDYISYAAFGYITNADLSQPVYGVPAYDNWPLEHAIKDLAYRGGIDSKLFTRPQQVNHAVGAITNVVDSLGSLQLLTRAKSTSGNLLLLQRNARYGNFGGAFDHHKSPDDLYLYRGQATRSILDWARELADTLGYDYRFEANGYVVLLPRNNPARYSKFTRGTSTFVPSAIGGTYQKNTASFGTETYDVNAARIDVVVGRSPVTGVLNYTVKNYGTTVAAGSIDTGLSSASSTGVFFYDNNFDTQGNNLCAFTLYTGKWGRYTVTLSDTGGGQWWLDSLVAYDRDINYSVLPSLQTDIMIEDLNTQSTAQESINNVVVVGAIKSTITDNQKAEKINNPDYEFYVARAVDPSSIWDPAATNYVGGLVSALIVDPKISNQDYANWAAQTLLIRQRDPGPSVRLRHPALPYIEPRDKVSILDAGFQTIVGTDKVWIQAYNETYERAQAVSELTLTAYSQIPSYEPQQSLTADQIDANFFGQAVINVNITYPSLDAGTVTNPGPNWTDARTWGYTQRDYYKTFEAEFSSYSNDAHGDYLNLSATTLWPPIPDSITLGLPSGTFPKLTQVYKNNPYMRFWHIWDYGVKRIHVPCLAGDSSVAYVKSGTVTSQGQPTGFNITAPHVTYKAIDSAALSNVYSGVSPFFDPYQSELPDGQLITISFDTLTTGYYRVSVWNAKNLSTPTLVAWLTEPASRDTDPDSHWTYLTPSRSVTFQWDGVDNIGEWNAQQSEGYAWKARGWFERDQKPEIGAGYYVWNDQSSPIVAISGQTTNGKLTFNPDHYAQFYVKIECKNDDFAAKAARQLNTNSIRVTDSRNLQGVTQGQNAKPSIYIYTHLPQPTTIQIAAIDDWDYFNQGAYDPIVNAFSETGWVASGSDYGASIRNDKPVRVTLQAIPRPGVRFQSNRAYTSFKVHNVVHLNLGTLDSFMMFMGHTWNFRTAIEEKRLVNRRIIDNRFTMEFVDADWRTGDTLDRTDQRWIFRPQDFTVDKDGITDALRYCDYLQVQDVPGFSKSRTIGQPWSRLILAYMAYIFYMSCYVQDRSGRMTWAIDPSFVDHSMLIKNGDNAAMTFPTTHPEELEDYSVRTIVARQWVDPNYKTTLASTWSIPSSLNGFNPQNFIQFFHQRLDINDNVAGDALTIDLNGNAVNGYLATGYTDQYSEYLRTRNGGELTPYGGSITSYLTNRQLGNWVDPSTLTNYFGQWTWEGDRTISTAVDPLWIPDLTRDFHPYYQIPPVVMEPTTTEAWRQVFPNTTWYNNYELYWYGQGTYDKAGDIRKYETWFANCFPSNDTRNYSNGFPHRMFRYPAWDVAHFVDYTLSDEYDDGKSHGIYKVEFDYSRQQEWMHWENYRGIFVSGPAPGVNTIYVSPGNPYVMNSRRYDLIIRGNRYSFGNDGDPSISVTGTPNTIDSTLVNSAPFTYVAQMRPYSDAGRRDRSWFTWTFRSKYNWYSSSYFPVSTDFKLHPRYLYPKYGAADIGQPIFFDTGAWVGWKDDLDSTVRQLQWRDSIYEAGAIYPYYSQDPNRRVNGHTTNDNIFTTGAPRMAIASGPRLAESKDVIITLALVNSRRREPVAGI